MNALTNDTDDRPCNRKVYTGRRGPEGCVVWAIDGNGERKPLNPRQELRNHSPTGVECLARLSEQQEDTQPLADPFPF